MSDPTVVGAPRRTVSAHPRLRTSFIGADGAELHFGVACRKGASSETTVSAPLKENSAIDEADRLATWEGAAGSGRARRSVRP